MTAKEALHELVDELSDDEAGFARLLLEDLRNAADSGGEALDEDALALLDRGLADVSAGRLTPLEEYERKRGL